MRSGTPGREVDDGEAQVDETTRPVHQHTFVVGSWGLSRRRARVADKVILHLMEWDGATALARLEGMFAFALYARQRRDSR